MYYNNPKQFLKSARSRLMNIWKIHPNFKCPVIGTCLSIEETKKVLKKAGVKTKRLTPYQLHKIIMCHIDEKNKISKKVDSFLKYKYRNILSNVIPLDENSFMEAWNKSLSTGEMDGYLYAAIIGQNLSKKNFITIFEDVHMLGHANLAEIMKSRRDLSFQAQANKKIARCLNKEKKRIRDMKKENVHLKRSLEKGCAQINKLKKQPVTSELNEKAVEKYKAENQFLRERFELLENKYNKQTNFLIRTEKERNQFHSELVNLKSINQYLANEINNFITQISSLNSYCIHPCNEQCPEFQLCAKRILIVGGLTKMKHLYKKLIESNGGKFDYHDGYMQNGNKDLEAQVKRSDIIICPVSCNSHTACHKVKQFCRKHNKSIKMLPTASLSAISTALHTKSKGCIVC
ncbi:DUF2325 domain-containing protein [Candidatus Magnetomoraceae bacterium gMMP-1]